MADPTGLSTGLLPWLVGYGLEKLFDKLLEELQLVIRCKKECKLFMEQLQSCKDFYEEIKSKNPSESDVVQNWLDRVKKCLEDSQALVDSVQNQNLSLCKRRKFGKSILTRRDDLEKLIGDQVRQALLFEINKNVQETAKTVQEIAPNVQETAKTVQEIAPNVQETAKTIQEIAPNVQEIAKTVQEIGTNVEEIKMQLSETTQIFMSSQKGNPQEIVAKLSSFNVRSAPSSSSSSPNLSLRLEEPIFGREAMITKLERLLLDAHGQKTVALHGGGGAGKTHIANALIKRSAIQSRFKIIWITASTISDLQREMEEEINENEGKSEKNILIVLDDIWRMDELNLVQGISQQHEFRFLITTRMVKLIEACKTVHPEPIEVLSEMESWDLFRYHAFRFYQEEDIPSTVSEVAKKVTRKCKGLPLALKVIGRAMSDKREVIEWDNALEDLQNKEIIEKDHDALLIQVLRVSYDALESKEEYMGKIRECFLYFGAFAEDEEINVTSLMNCWVGEGLLQDGKDPMKQTYMVLGVLIGYSLVEKVPNKKDRCKIHDVMRDLTFYISKKERPQEDRFEPRHEDVESLVNLVDDKIVRISWRWRRFSEVQIVAQNLKVLLLDQSNIGEKCLDGAFESLRSLQVLSLQNTLIKYLPDSLGKLSCLVVLDLAGCSGFEKLPDSLGKLKKLKVLDLSRCFRLKTFPELLHLEDIQVLKLPNQSDSSNLLRQLERKWERLERKWERKWESELERLRKWDLSELEHWELRRHWELRQELKLRWELVLVGDGACWRPKEQVSNYCDGDTVVIQKGTKMSVIRMEKSTTLTCLIFSSNNLKLLHLNTESMTQLSILHMDCPITDIEPLKRLSKLEELKIFSSLLSSLPDWISEFKFLSCLNIHTVNSEAYYLPALDALRRLCNLQIGGWKLLTCFPRCPPSLRELHINDCECLEGFSDVGFDSLYTLKIWKCKKLLEHMSHLPIPTSCLVDVLDDGEKSISK